MQKTKRWQPKKFVYVQVQNRAEGIDLSYCIAVKKDFNAPKAKLLSVDSLEDLIKKTGKFTPYVFHVLGQGVLTRLVENAPNYKESLLVNGAIDEFYFHSFTLGNQIACSFVRKSLLSAFMEQVEKQKLFVLDLLCGPINVFTILDSNDNYQGDFTFLRDDKSIQIFKKNEETPKTLYYQSSYLNTEQVYLQSAFTGLFEDTQEEMETALASIDKQAAQTNYTQFNQFRFFGIALLAFFLIALSSNYFYINYLNNQTAQLEMDISSYSQDLSLIEQLKQEKARKMQLIETSGIHTKYYLSNLSDLIGQSVPGEVKLTELEIYPLEENLKPKMKVNCMNDVILIHGISQSSKVLDDWMEKLGTLKGIQAVELMNYIRMNEKTAEFQLSLKVNE
jgi:Tfp pilus assembly protein PilN